MAFLIGTGVGGAVGERVRLPVAVAADEEGKESLPAGETARHVGTVVHQWLQRMAEEELRGWTRERIEKLAPRFRQDLFS